MPATGQTTSYTSGDDGDYEKGFVANGPRFTDNADGTVKDNLTGLIWLKNLGCLGLRNWAGALFDANTLANGPCGLTDGSVAGDWRVPNLRELQSLIDFQNSVPALPTGHPFSGVQSNLFVWSSTSFAQSPGSAWLMNVDQGNFLVYGKTVVSYVWPVRGGQ